MMTSEDWSFTVEPGGRSASTLLADPPPGGARRPERDGPGAVAPPVGEGRAERNLLWLGLTSVTVGLCVVLFVGYVFVFSGFQERRHQTVLLGDFHTKGARAALIGEVPAEGDPVGILQIPALGLRQVIVEGTSATDLLQGPGIMPGTARPGTRGNAVIAGRRSAAGAPFADIGSLRPGDRIIVTTGLGRYVYHVTRVATASTGSTDPVSETRQARVTLVTSNPAYLPTGRLYVVAKLSGSPASGPATAIPRHGPDVTERGLSGDPGAVWPSLLWGLALAAALGATIWAYQRWRQHVWAIYLLTTPIVLALALVWYSNLIRLLPATL